MFVKESLSLMGISCKGCSLGRTKLWKRKWISSRSAFILVKPLFSDQTNPQDLCCKDQLDNYSVTIVYIQIILSNT